MKNVDEKFLRLAIDEAKKSSESVGCGVIIVKNGEVLAKTHNTQRETNNASAHAEISAIQKAGKKLGRKRLEGCTMYCTTEPCIMCLSAASYAKIKRLVFGLTMKETYNIDRIIDIVDINGFIEKSPHKFEYEGGILKEECMILLGHPKNNIT